MKCLVFVSYLLSYKNTICKHIKDQVNLTKKTENISQVIKVTWANITRKCQKRAFSQYYVILRLTLIHHLLKVLQFKANFWSVISSSLNKYEMSLVLIKLDEYSYGKQDTTKQISISEPKLEKQRKSFQELFYL